MSNTCPDLPYPGWQGRRLSSAQLDKVLEISSLCDSSPNLEGLTTLATSKDGLVDDEVRRRAWPILLGCPAKTTGEVAAATRWRDLPRHKDEDQVELDVNRSFVYYPKDETDLQLEKRKQELSAVIVQVLREHPMLCYFQGFHDVVQVFLLVLGVDHAPAAVAHLALLRIRDFMLPSLSPSIAHLKLIPVILNVMDPKLYLHLSPTQPFFALSATLTLYAHDIQEYGDIARLFDFLIAQPAVVSVYFFAVIVRSRREELFDVPADEPEMLHFILSKLPKPLNLEALIAQTMQVFVQYPPESMPGSVQRSISQYSVLKTTQRTRSGAQTIHDGETLFAMQALQLRREEMWKGLKTKAWKYRRPASVGLAISVGVLSLWIGRNGMHSLLGWKVIGYGTL